MQDADAVAVQEIEIKPEKAHLTKDKMRGTCPGQGIPEMVLVAGGGSEGILRSLLIVRRSFSALISICPEPRWRSQPWF